MRNPRPVIRLPPVLKDARRGVTLIEAVLFISVALGLIVGGLVFYQQASRSATHQAVVRQLQAVQGELRAMYQVSNWDRLGNTGDSPRLTPVLVHMGAIPQEMIQGNPPKIFLAYGGELSPSHVLENGAGITKGHTVTEYLLWNVPEWLCTRLVVADSVRGVLNPGQATSGDIIDVGNGVLYGKRCRNPTGSLA